jgi:hypothetical protein
MNDQTRLTPKRIRTYLIANGWREQVSLSPAGVMFALSIEKGSEKQATVFLPELETAIDYPLRVNDVLETLMAVEDRSRTAVLADIHAEKLDVVGVEGTRSTTDKPLIESVSETGKP